MNQKKRILILLFITLILFLKNSESQVNPLNVYLSSIINSYTDTIAYPKAGMGTGNIYGIEDWTYNSPKLDLYVLLSGNQSLYAAEMSIQWDANLFYVNAEPGNLFDLYYFDTISTAPGNLKINIASLSGNVMPALGKYLVNLKILILKPGYSNVVMINPDYRYFDNITNTQQQIPLTVTNGAVKFYLGDFARRRTVIDLGDGDVNFKDASVFFQHYASAVGDGIYRTKFDIASLGNLNYYLLPVPDGLINFWDMVMFVTGYELEGSGQLLIKTGKEEIAGVNNPNIKCSLGNIVREGSNIRIPVKITGDLNVLKGASISVTYNSKYYEFLEVSEGEIYKNTNYMSAHREQGSTVYLDAVSVSRTVRTNTGEITAGYIVLKEKESMRSGNTEISITSFDAVDYNNGYIKTELINK